MQRSWLKFTAAVCVAAALLAGASARAADKVFVGNWKLTNVTTGNELTYILFQVEEKDGKLQAKVLSAPLLPESKATIENFKADAKRMQFDIKFAARHAGRQSLCTPGRRQEQGCPRFDHVRFPTDARAVCQDGR